jgi:hypothetical protein
MARCRQMRIASGAERPFGQGLVTLACGAFCQGWEPCGTFGGESHNSWWESFLRKINGRINLVSNFFYIFVL